MLMRDGNHFHKRRLCMELDILQLKKFQKAEGECYKQTGAAVWIM